MLPVIYSMSVSLDGFIAGPDGDIGWTAPDAEQFRFHIEQTRHVAAHLCGRGRSAADRVPDLQRRRRLPSLSAHALSLASVGGSGVGLSC